MAVYSTHLLDYEQLKLGSRIRDARLKRGLTLKQLANRLTTSSARLSQIENERLRLDVEDVIAVAGALDVGVDTLVPADVRLPFQIVRDAGVRQRSARAIRFASADGRSGVESPHAYWPLADLFAPRHLQPMLGRIVPLEESALPFCCHDEEEFAFALRGPLEFWIETPEGRQRETLARGDSIYFRSDLPHAFRSLASDPVDTLHVFCSPSASTEGGMDLTQGRAIACTTFDGLRDRHRRVGERLRLLRERHGWSVDRVAHAVGLSERRVLRIERGEQAAPLDAVMKLARTFGRPLRELVAVAESRPPYYAVQRSRDIPSVPVRRRRTPVERPDAPPSKTCQPLTAAFPARDMYPHFVRLLNVDVETLVLHEHHGEEFIYVLDGELELTTYAADRPVREVLQAGDSVYLDSTVPHLLRSWTRNPFSDTSAEVIDVFWCPLGEGYLFDV